MVRVFSFTALVDQLQTAKIYVGTWRLIIVGKIYNYKGAPAQSHAVLLHNEVIAHAFGMLLKIRVCDKNICTMCI